MTEILKEPVIFDPEKVITQLELESEDDRWTDFKWICRGGDNRKPEDVIAGFNFVDKSIEDRSTDSKGLITLPDAMYKYNDWPSEEGIAPEGVLEIMKGYNDSLIKLTEKETNLGTQVECAVYAEQYLDTLDQIAYLFNTRALATDASTYFENNFAFGLTLKIWYDLRVAGSKGQERRWDEFLKYCKGFEDDEYNPIVLKAFNVKDVLPASMLFIDDLPIDSIDSKCVKTNDNKEKECIYKKDGDGKLNNIHTDFYDWQEFYNGWVKIQEKKIENRKDQESIEKAINYFKCLHNIDP